MNILIVDDHPLFRHALIQAVRYSLPQAQIQETADVDEFYARLEHGAEPDLVLLDLNLPGASGFSALVYVRAQYPAIPIIIVSARNSDEDINAALERGADDYLTKPIAPKLLLSRLQTVLKRSASSSTHIGYADSLRLDLAKRIAEARGKQVELTEMEFNILRFLMDHPGLVYTPYQISQELRSELLRYVNPRRVEKDVYDLRTKLALAGDYIENVVGVGVRFCSE